MRPKFALNIYILGQVDVNIGILTSIKPSRIVKNICAYYYYFLK